MNQAFVLVDTSAWIEMLRPPATSSVAKRVQDLLREGIAAICDVVLLELWHGARGKQERLVIAEMQRVLTCFKVDSKVWSRSWKLAQQAQQSGITCPTADLIIAGCAFEYKIQIEHCDKHFNLLERFRD